MLNIAQGARLLLIDCLDCGFHENTPPLLDASSHAIRTCKTRYQFLTEYVPYFIYYKEFNILFDSVLLLGLLFMRLIDKARTINTSTKVACSLICYEILNCFILLYKVTLHQIFKFTLLVLLNSAFVLKKLDIIFHHILSFVIFSHSMLSVVLPPLFSKVILVKNGMTLFLAKLTSALAIPLISVPGILILIAGIMCCITLCFGLYRSLKELGIEFKKDGYAPNEEDLPIQGSIGESTLLGFATLMDTSPAKNRKHYIFPQENKSKPTLTRLLSDSVQTSDTHHIDV